MDVAFEFDFEQHIADQRARIQQESDEAVVIILNISNWSDHEATW